nr:hypothetical protein [Lentzea terrae]
MNWRASAATSSLPDTGMRRVRSSSVISAAACRTIRTGTRITPATNHAISAAISRPASDTSTSTRTVESTGACTPSSK